MSTPVPPPTPAPQPDPAPDATSPADAAPAEVPWQRLSARMLLIHPVRELVRLLPALLGLLVAGNAGDGDGPPWWVGVAGVVLPVLLGVLRWATTRYRITGATGGGQVQLRQGLVSTHTTTAPLERVRTVDVTASPLHRVLGLATVAVGTGADETSLRLDGLPAATAAGLRAELLHRTAAGTADGDLDATGSTAGPPSPADEEELARLNPAWARYAPLGTSGLVALLGLAGVVWQAGDRLLTGRSADVERSVTDLLARFGVLAVAVAGALAVLVTICLLAIGGYLVGWWGMRLTRDRARGTLHLTRGLLTTRATTLESRRVRGVAFAEPLLVRLARGARLSAITTGLQRGGDGGDGSSQLLPSAPVGVVRDVAERVLDAPGVLGVPLVGHGPAARRRRWTRALAGASVLAAAIVAAAWWGASAPRYALLAVVPLLAAAPLAADRARSLGHALTDRHLLTRSGSLVRTTDVLERDAAVAVVVRRSFFQRRAGLSTLRLATAAGDEAYDVLDVPHGRAVEMAGALLPGHVEPLLRRPGG